MYTLGIDNVIIVSGNFEYEPFVGSVCVQGERIAEVRRGPVSPSECGEWIDGGGKILMPGLVNCHCHGDMTLARGLGDDMTLLEQNEAYRSHNWFKTYIDGEDLYYSRQLTYCESLLAGCTFVCENMYWGMGAKSVQAMKEIGIKGALVEDIRHNFTDSESFLSDDMLRDFSTGCREAGIIPVIGLPSEENWETEVLKKIFAKLQNIEAMQTMHLAENDWRVNIILEKYGLRPIEYLAKKGFLHDKLIGSHVVFANKNEVELLKKANVKIANTPLCEMKIADGIAPIPEMVRQGLAVGIGTDGALWNNSNDIFREMKGMSLLHTVSTGIRSISKKDILDMATRGGAAVFGMESEIGMIKEGMKADMILIDTEQPHLQPMVLGKNENVISAIIYNATGGDVTDVFVNGKQLVKDGVLTSTDVWALIARVQQTVEKIAREI